MKIDPKKFYWFRQVGNHAPRPMKYIPSYTCFVCNPELPGSITPTGFTDPKDAIEKMKPDSKFFRSVMTDSPDPDIYTMFDSSRFGEAGTKHLLVNGRKATEYLVRLKIAGSNE